MDEDARLVDVFLDIQRGLPRQGPGSDDSTLRALSLCRGLPERPAVLDIGCGPGMQTLALANALNGPVTAVDLHREYLDELTDRAGAAHLADRIETLQADMGDLPFPPNSFDLIWSEGAAYIIGVANALAAWRDFLKPGGFLVVSDMVWLRPDRPADAAAFFADGYPAMTDIDTNLTIVKDRGYEPTGHFTLPDSDWWDLYYTPLEAKLPALREKYAGDDSALGVIEMTEREIEIRRRFGDCYGYAFFVGRKAG